MPPLKVAVNGAFLDRPDTGSGQYVIHLLDELRKPEHVVEAVVSRLPSDGNLAKLRFEQIGFPAAARAAGAAVAHVPYFGSALFPRLPTVITIHDLIPIVLPLYRGSAKVQAYTKLVSLAAQRASIILADSAASKRDILAHLGVDARKVQVVYLAADERYRPVTDAATLDAVREKYKLPEQFVLYLGGFDQRKNVPNLVRAFAKVARGLGPDYSLVLAGRLPATTSAFFPDVRAVVQEMELTEHVRWTGEVDEADKPALYTLASCFAFPSYYEGFGLPVLEAMACGTPAITSNVSSLPEVAGDAALTVAPGDPQALGDAMSGVLHEPARREAMRARGLRQAARFTWPAAAAQTAQVYDEVLAGARAPSNPS